MSKRKYFVVINETRTLANLFRVAYEVVAPDFNKCHFPEFKNENCFLEVKSFLSRHIQELVNNGEDLPKPSSRSQILENYSGNIYEVEVSWKEKELNEDEVEEELNEAFGSIIPDLDWD